MSEISDFGELVLVVAAGFTLALLSTKVTERVRVPAPAVFLLAAAIAAELFEGVGEFVAIRDVERIAVVALVIILFDGGMNIGWRRFRASAIPVVSLGFLGTFATAGAMAVLAHALFGFDWISAGILGAALAPTDPAVTFSVLRDREVGGRSGTVLEGEAGFNDPVGIALMIGMLELAEGEGESFAIVIEEFALEMSIGLGVGIAGAGLLLPLMQRVTLPSESFYPLRTLAAAGVIYGATSIAHGSGFLAVFVAGLLLGDARAPYKGEIERFQGAFASLAEIVVFAALGMTIDLSSLGEDGVLLDGVLLALLLGFVARPLVIAALLAPVRLRWGERLFVIWGGLKGAVPILLAAFAVLAAVEEAGRIYDIVFIVVLFSVIVQGSLVPFVARLLDIPIRVSPRMPWDVSIRLEREPKGLQRYQVARGSVADGRALRDLPFGEDTWVAIVIHDGEAVQARDSYVAEPGDEVLVQSDPAEEPDVRQIFEKLREEAASGNTIEE